MDNVESNQTPRLLTQETDSISIVPTLKGSDSTLFNCWRVPISRNSVFSLFSKRRSLTIRDRGAGGRDGRHVPPPPPQYFKTYRELVRKSVL